MVKTVNKLENFSNRPSPGQKYDEFEVLTSRKEDTAPYCHGLEIDCKMSCFVEYICEALDDFGRKTGLNRAIRLEVTLR